MRKILNRRNNHEKKFGIHETPTKKIGTHEIPTRKKWDPQNTGEKKFGTHVKKYRAHEIPTRKYFQPTKCPRGHNGTIALDPRDPRWLTIHEI